MCLFAPFVLILSDSLVPCLHLNQTAVILREAMHKRHQYCLTDIVSSHILASMDQMSPVPVCRKFQKRKCSQTCTMFGLF